MRRRGLGDPGEVPLGRRSRRVTPSYGGAENFFPRLSRGSTVRMTRVRRKGRAAHGPCQLVGLAIRCRSGKARPLLRRAALRRDEQRFASRSGASPREPELESKQRIGSKSRLVDVRSGASPRRRRFALKSGVSPRRGGFARLRKRELVDVKSGASPRRARNRVEGQRFASKSTKIESRGSDFVSKSSKSSRGAALPSRRAAHRLEEHEDRRARARDPRKERRVAGIASRGREAVTRRVHSRATGRAPRASTRGRPGRCPGRGAGGSA